MQPLKVNKLLDRLEKAHYFMIKHAELQEQIKYDFPEEDREELLNIIDSHRDEFINSVDELDLSSSTWSDAMAKYSNVESEIEHKYSQMI
jgi:hypothetical protein